MSIRTQIKHILRDILRRNGFDIVPSAYVYDWQIGEEILKELGSTLPEEAQDHLRPDNPALQHLEQRYRQFADYPSGEVLLWTPDRVSPEDMRNFRGHTAYVFQEGRFNRNPFGYLLAYYYTKSLDRYRLLDKLEEDGAFGAVRYVIDGRQVSRDLLDSVLEIYFLQDHLKIMDFQKLRVLDIGAGYGRLAHRMAEALPNLEDYACTDAVAVSTFLCAYYLKYRGLGDNTRVIPLDRVYEGLQPGTIDLAVNIHSFSECTLPVIEWWLEVLRDMDVPALMIVPNSGADLLTNDGRDFRPLVEQSGYQLTACQPKYLDPLVQKYALNPDHFHLFRRT